MPYSARSASTVDLRGTRPAVRLPQTTRRSGFSAWIGDERMSTFVLSAPGQPPRQSELQRLKLLDAREPRPAEGPIEVPKVHFLCHVAQPHSLLTCRASPWKANSSYLPCKVERLSSGPSSTWAMSLLPGISTVASPLFLRMT